MNAMDITQQCEAIRLAVQHQPPGKIDARRVADFLTSAQSYAVTFCRGLIPIVNETRELAEAHAEASDATAHRDRYGRWPDSFTARAQSLIEHRAQRRPGVSPVADSAD